MTHDGTGMTLNHLWAAGAALYLAFLVWCVIDAARRRDYHR